MSERGGGSSRTLLICATKQQQPHRGGCRKWGVFVFTERLFGGVFCGVCVCLQGD